MKNTFGNALSVTLFGESHGEAIGAVLDGLSPGITVDEEFIISRLSRRRAQGKTSTARTEADVPHIVSGVFEGKTTGTPVTILIYNENTKSKDYDATRALARPSHADYTAYKKYLGFEDYRGGGQYRGICPFAKRHPHRNAHGALRGTFRSTVRKPFGGY